MTTVKIPKEPMRDDEEEFTFEDIDYHLYELGLSNPSLEVLKPDSKLYKALLFQTCGDVEAGKDIESSRYYIRNKEREVASKKFEAFFELARKRKVHLAITPEYSCPWDVIEKNIIDEKNIDRNFPEEQNLWVVGCESITQRQLKEITEKNNKKIYWVVEKDILNPEKDELDPEEDNMFLDPLCYFFKTKKIENKESVNVVIVQFKTQFMGGDPFEKEHLILGKITYILRNLSDSNNLVTLICSDALAVKLDRLPDKTQRTYLILHVQLNKNPFHTVFSDYRIKYYGEHEKERDFICLNWARNSSIIKPQKNNSVEKSLEEEGSSKGKSLDYKPRASFGGSALYTKTNKLNLKDERLHENHENGLYYSYYPPARSHIYFFNYDEYVFEFKNNKTCQENSSIVTQGNSGPLMGAAYKWKNSGEDIGWEVLDQITETCDLCDTCIDISRYCPLADKNLNSINKERFIALSLGELIFSDWPDAKSICFLHTTKNNESNEVNRRLTFLHDPLGNDDKHTTMNYFFDLCNIITDKSNFPECLSDLAENCILKYKPGGNNYNYLYNLYSKNNQMKASVAYIANKKKPYAISVYSQMCELFRDSQSGKRIVVWFKGINGIESICDNASPKFTGCSTHPNNSFLKGGELN